MIMGNTNLVLIRHADAKKPVRDGQILVYDRRARITQQGYININGLANTFNDRDFKFDAIYFSPFFRAVMTAGEFVNSLNPKLRPERFTSMDEFAGAFLPQWELQPEVDLDEVRDIYKHNPKLENIYGESPIEVYDRLWKGFMKVWNESRGKNIGVVMHAETISPLIVRLMGYSFEEGRQMRMHFRIKNAEAFRLLIDSDLKVIENEKLGPTFTRGIEAASIC